MWALRGVAFAFKGVKVIFFYKKDNIGQKYMGPYKGFCSMGERYPLYAPEG